MDQERTQAPLPQGQQPGRGQGPGQGHPGPQVGPPGHGPGRGPGSQGPQRHRHQDQGVEHEGPVQAHDPSQGHRQGQDRQEGAQGGVVAVPGGRPGAPGRLPQPAGSAVQAGQGAPGQAPAGQGPPQGEQPGPRREKQDRRQHVAASSGQGAQLVELELAGGLLAGGPLPLLTHQVTAQGPDLGAVHVQAGQHGAGDGGVGGQTASAPADQAGAGGHGQGRAHLVAGADHGVGQQAPGGPQAGQEEEPGQQQPHRAGGEGGPGAQLGGAAGTVAARRRLLPGEPLGVLRVPAQAVAHAPPPQEGGPAVGDHGVRDHDHPVPGQTDGTGQLQAVTESTEGR